MPGWQLGQFLRQTASKTLFYTPILLVVNQAFVTQVPINGRSMQPTLNPDPAGGSRDRVLVERLSPRVYRYERGKVVLFRSPEDPNVYVVKRLIALEGDWLMLPGETETITVPKGHCWVEGDNHACSEDSRTKYGPVPVALIEGSVTHIVWPPSRISKVPARPMHSRLLAVNMKPYASDRAAHRASTMTETEQMQAGDLRERVSQVVVALAGPQGLKPTAGTALLQVWLPNDSEHGDSILSTKGAPFCLHGESDLVALFRCLSCRHQPSATQPSRHAPLDAVARVYLSGQAEAAEQVDRQAKEVYWRAHDAGMCRIARTLLLPLFDSNERQKAIGVLEVVHSHDLSVEALHARLQPALKAADLFVQESPSAMWDMQEHCMALGLPVQASTDTTSAQTALGNASIGLPQGQQVSQASGGQQLSQADMSPSSAGQMQLPEGAPQGPPQIMELLQQQHEQQTQDARGESMRAAACLLQVAQMAAADGRQSSGDQSEAAAELIANSSHHGLTKQTSQPVSASQQDTGGLYTNGSAGVGARSSTGAQKALTMEDLQAHFGVGLKEAAKRLGVCATTLKRACRRHGIKRWPRRQLMKLSRALDGVEQVQSTGGLGHSLPAGQVLGSLYRQQQAAAVAAQQALQGGQESEDDMDEDGGGDGNGGPMRKAASVSLPCSASGPQKQMQQPMSAAPAGGLYDMGSWPLSLSGTPSGSMASASSNMLGLTGPNMAGLQRLLQQQGQQRLAASLGSLSNMGSLPASLSINSVLDPSKLAGEGPGSRQSSIQIRTQPQFRSDSISSSQPQQGMGGNPPPSPTPAASQQQANMAALFNPFAVARQQDPLGSSVPLPVVSMLQGQGEQDGGLAHALNAGFNPAGSVDAHLQQQQLLQQRQLSAHSTTSELQLEGRQLSGQKPGMLLPMDGALQNGVSGLELQARLNSVKQTSMPGSTPVQLLMAMLGGQGMGNRTPAMLPSDSVHQTLQGPTPMPGQQPSGRG